MDCRCLVHLRLFCSISKFFTSSLLFFFSFSFSLIFLVLLSTPLFPAISVAAQPRAAITIADGNAIVSPTPPATMTNDSSDFPNTFSFAFLMSLFILPSYYQSRPVVSESPRPLDLGTSSFI